jgi:hypothetical protein
VTASRTASLRRRWLALWTVLLSLAAVASLILPSPGRGVPASGPLSPQPVLSAAGLDLQLLGSAPGGLPGEAWGYRQLPLSVGSVEGGARTQFGRPSNPFQPRPQLVFTRHTDATGWQVWETPRDRNGEPYRGPVPNPRSGRITPRGGGLLVGRDPERPPEDQVVVLVRDPAGRFRELPPLPEGVLLAGEALAGDRGGGRVAVDAFDEGGRTGIFIAPVGGAVTDGIVHHDGVRWSREPIDVPTGSEAAFDVIAVAAGSQEDAWALAVPDPAIGRGLVLLHRGAGPSGPRWRERPLGAPDFAGPNVQPVGGASQPLTATTAGVWIDGAFSGGADFTLFYDESNQRVTGSWCDGPPCGAPLGIAFARRDGYRSFAWAGPGFGTRVVTNPLDPGGAEETNDGTWLRFDGQRFARMPGAGGNFRMTGAFGAADAGWLEGPVEITARPAPTRLRAWPVALRAPLVDVAPAPGTVPGSLGAQAIAAGGDGGVARYEPGRGWQREFLLTSSDSVNRANLRGVAWPEPARAHAVGDLGAMWQWNADNDRWEPDPGAPVGLEANLMDVAFEPGNPDRGYAVGKGGVLLSYGKSWEQELLPPGTEGRDLTQIAFAGGQALVAAGPDLLVNDGSGWRVDAGVKALLDPVRPGNPLIVAVAGLPDGGAVAAGRDFVLERDGAGAPWRFSDQPLPDLTVVAAAAVRAGPRVQAVVSVAPLLAYPPADEIPPPDPTVPPPILPPFPLPGDGYVLRETEHGWIDEQRQAFPGSGSDRPFKADPILAFALDPAGNGWAVGGWGGDADSAGRGSSARNTAGREIRARVRTAGIYRYGDDAGTPPTAATVAPVPMGGGLVRFAVAGHAQCERPCADLALQGIGPDLTLSAALGQVAALRGQQQGPRLMLYTGGRVREGGVGPLEAGRYAQLLSSQPAVPVYPALAAGDDPTAFASAFAGFPAPFGAGPGAPGTNSDGVPGAPPGPGARTHYAFDSDGPGGRVRIVVIDNSAGSLAASDPHQNPPEPQLPWLQSALADARAEGVPVVVMGSRDLNTRFTPRLNVAGDGDEVARVLVEGGASAYVFDRPEENRISRIPAAAADTIPAFASGTLGYRSPIVGGVRSSQPDSLFGDSGFLLLEIDAARRDPATNRAPVSARLIPVIEDLSLQALDGTLLRRSRPALFRGLGRRPRAGDRWGRVAAGDGNPNPPGGDPYINFPPEQCLIAGCSARMDPEFEFASSDPDIADFVRQDPNSTNLRKPYIDPANDQVVSDARSGLLCAFNAGTTTVSVRAGGFAFTQQVRVQAGSVQRPCGTRPLNPSRFPPRRAPVGAPPAPPPPAPAGNPPADLAPPPPPPPPAVAQAPPPPPPPPPSPEARPAAPPPPPFRPLLPPIVPVPLQAPALINIPAVPPPPPPPLVRPLPPGGMTARVYQVEEKREEEAAFEESQAFSRFEQDGGGVPPYLIGLVLLAAFAGASIRGGPRPRPVPADNRTRSRT